jgi:hypothetical protein
MRHGVHADGTVRLLAEGLGLPLQLVVGGGHEEIAPLAQLPRSATAKRPNPAVGAP